MCPIHHMELGHCTFSILVRGDEAEGCLWDGPLPTH
ncbi:hypothetical protein ABIE20_005525, partial [Pseudomonas sp. 2835]